MKRSLVTAAIALSLQGCFAETDTLLKAKGPEIADATLSQAEWYMCSAATVGSIRRRFGRDEVLAQAWRDLCQHGETVELIEPAQ